MRTALAALRRTGFLVLVVAGSVAKAQAALSFEAPQAYGSVDPSEALDRSKEFRFARDSAGEDFRKSGVRAAVARAS